MFREQITIPDGALVGATVTKTYGSATTAQGAGASLFGDALAALKVANPGAILIGTDRPNNRLLISKSAVIDSLTPVELLAPSYSAEQFLNINDAYEYGNLTSTKNIATIETPEVKVKVVPAVTTIPPTPIVPVVPPTPSRNTVVVAGGGNSFQLAGAEGTCSADTLEQCECESATSTAGVAMAGVQICYGPKNGPSTAL
jgi:hypothetical protein